ncbi:MAG: tetratricopeptide repeat protein [Desulfobacterales bacterium]
MMILSAITERLRRMRAYKKGMDFLNRRNYAEAIEEFRYIIENTASPKSLHLKMARFFCGQAHRSMGLLHFTLGSYAKAADAFAEALALNPEHYDIYEYMGICYNNMGDFQKAVKAFSNILAREPSHLPLKIRMGLAFHNLGMWDKSLRICRDFLKTCPDYANVHFYMGLSLLGQRKASEAVKAFENALRINPAYKDAQIRLGLVHAFLGNYYDAFFHLSLVSETYPDYADLYYFLGLICTGAGNLSEAADFFQKAVEKNPRYTDAKVKMGMIYCRMGKKREALAAFADALSDDPENGNLKKLAEYMQHCECELPEWISDSRNLISHAMENLNHHIEIAPNFSEMLSIVKNFPDENTDVYESIIPLVRESADHSRSYPDSCCSLGALYFKTGKYADAENSFAKALERNPEYVQARVYLIKTLEKQEKYADALHHGEILLRKKLPWPDFHCTLGKICLALKMTDRAEEFLQSALKTNPAYAEARLMLAKLRMVQGNTDDAAAELQKCLAANPPRDIEQEAQKSLLKLKNLIP